MSEADVSDFLHTASTVAVGLVVLLYVTAFTAGGLSVVDSRFGRAVFFGGTIAIGVGAFLRFVVPDLLPALGVRDVHAMFALAVAVLLAGAVGAFLDLVGWVRGERREPPPPFEK